MASSHDDAATGATQREHEQGPHHRRRVTLPDGRRLRVRPASAADVDGLLALHEGLSEEDRYRRFFSCFRVDREFCERLVARPDHGGRTLVAEIGDGDGTTIVGEADFSRLPNGDGELAIAVDRRWRGWLASYLLDALVEVAADAGIANLEADVLTANRQMLAVLRHRGYATIGHPDWSVVRLCIGARARRPTWPTSSTARRVLVEVPGARWRLEDRARDAGAAVMACPGPTPPHRCPMLEGSRCPLADVADIIVLAPPRARPGGPARAIDGGRWRALAETHDRQHPWARVVVDEGADLSAPDPLLAAMALTEGGAVRADT